MLGRVPLAGPSAGVARGVFLYACGLAEDVAAEGLTLEKERLELVENQVGGGVAISRNRSPSTSTAMATPTHQ